MAISRGIKRVYSSMEPSDDDSYQQQQKVRKVEHPETFSLDETEWLKGILSLNTTAFLVLVVFEMCKNLPEGCHFSRFSVDVNSATGALLLHSSLVDAAGRVHLRQTYFPYVPDLSASSR